MTENFYKVSAVRRDGGAQETTFIGYGAESCAFQFAQSLEGKYMRYVAVIRRDHIEGQSVQWDLVHEWHCVGLATP